eukprot:ANDGO_07003.mRNA.1 Uncharacterized protein YwjB
MSSSTNVMVPKVKYYVACSVDGFIARPDGAVDWLPPLDSAGKGEDYGYAEFLSGIGTVLMGRKTYDTLLVLHGGAGAANPYPDQRVFVYTTNTSIQKPPTNFSNVEFVFSDPCDHVHRLISQDQPISTKDGSTGRDIWLCGGGLLAKTLLQRGLIDEFIVSTVPVLLGAGIPLVSTGFSSVRLSATSSKFWPMPSGITQTVYQKLP